MLSSPLSTIEFAAEADEDDDDNVKGLVFGLVFIFDEVDEDGANDDRLDLLLEDDDRCLLLLLDRFTFEPRFGVCLEDIFFVNDDDEEEDNSRRS